MTGPGGIIGDGVASPDEVAGGCPAAKPRARRRRRGWRTAFFVPGLLAMAAGVAFLLLVPDPGPVVKKSKTIGLHLDARTMAQIFVILLVATACGGVIFNSTTVAMPKKNTAIIL